MCYRGLPRMHVHAHMPASIDASQPAGPRTRVRLTVCIPEQAVKGFMCAALTLRPVQLAMSAMLKLAATCMRPGSVAGHFIQVHYFAGLLTFPGDTNAHPKQAVVA